MLRRIGLWIFAAMLFFAAPAAADTIDVNGATRTFIAMLPAPLVIVLHGRIQRGTDIVTRTSWPLIARRDSFAVAFPDGLNQA